MKVAVSVKRGDIVMITAQETGGNSGDNSGGNGGGDGEGSDGEVGGEGVGGGGSEGGLRTGELHVLLISIGVAIVKRPSPTQRACRLLRLSG